MSSPWMKFYPTDWRADPALRMCSLGARGLWMEMLCLMHEAEPYGHLVVKGVAITQRQLAALSGCSLREVSMRISELESSSVFDVLDGVIISRRMVRDRVKALRDKENGRAGGNPVLIKNAPDGVNPPDNVGDKAQIPEARSQKKNSSLRSQCATEFFDEFWQAYPRREGSNPRKPAKDRFDGKVRAGADPAVIIAGVRAYAVAMATEPPRFVVQAVKWLSQERWNDVHVPPAPRLAVNNQPQAPPGGYVSPYAGTPKPMPLEEARAAAKRFHEQNPQWGQR